MTDFQQINDFVEYLQALKRAENVLVLMAAKDTLGYHIGKAGYSALKDLGLTKIGSHPKEEEHQCGYAAVFRNSEVLFEELASRDGEVSFSDELAGVSVKVISSPYHAGNFCELWVNGIQYGLNTRGINIVVVDSLSQMVVDAVCFDTHRADYHYFRRNNVNELQNKRGKHLSLYYMCTASVFFSGISYSQGLGDGNQIVYLLDHGIASTRGYLPFFSAMKENGLCFDYISEINLLMPKSESCSEDEAIHNLCKYIERAIITSGYSLDDFERIYVFDDNWDVDFPTYLNIIHYRYTFIECLVHGIYKSSAIFDWINPIYNKIFDQFQPFNGLAEYADAVLPIESNEAQNEFDKRGKCYTTWDRQEALKRISQDNFHIILRSFGVPLSRGSLNGAVMLLLNSNVVAENGLKYRYTFTPRLQNLLGIEDSSKDYFQSTMNNIVLDCIASNEHCVVIKTHPNDPISEESGRLLYGEDILILNNIPFEFLKRYFDEEKIVLKQAIGYISTSLQMLSSENYVSSVVLGKDVFCTFFFYISLYVITKLAEDNGLKLAAENYMATQLKALLEARKREDIDVIEDVHKPGAGTDEQVAVINSLMQGMADIPRLINEYNKYRLLLFVNLELCDDCIFPEQYLKKYMVIQIKEDEIRDLPVKTERDEYIWIYAKDQRNLRDLKIDAIEKTLPRRGLHFKTQVLTSAEKYEHYRQMTMESRFNYEMSEVQVRSQILQGLTEHLMEKDGYLRQEAASMLRCETDFNRYLRTLALMQKNVLILLAVRDTPGDHLSVQTLRLLHDLRFSNFQKRLWLMYTGISNKGEVLLNQSGGRPEETVTYEHHADRSLPDIFIQSSAWRKENVAIIRVDGKDYSANIRGINIVVYDLAANEVIDSVGYDRHTEDVKFVHLEK